MALPAARYREAEGPRLAELAERLQQGPRFAAVSPIYAFTTENLAYLRRLRLRRARL